ncbi:unnamed protein product [Calicophoron daubneyi]|uniref:TAF6 C-terminal HEAT repeat domain-containing protein n=1 Tax=Calicophoron daubneyi TaxID=300641 RepID=A0AAV2TW20_CALDB
MLTFRFGYLALIRTPMDGAERRKLNRLLRKPIPSSAGKSGSAKQKLSNRIHKQSRVAVSTVNEDEGKQHGISVDVAKLCAEMCGVSNLSAPAALLLQKHMNQLARLLIQGILRVMEQSRRGVPQASDVDLASVLTGLEAPFGTTPANFLPIRTGGRTASSGPGGKVFFIRPDKEIDLKALLLREPAGVVYDASLVAHWLAVNGKQPISPQNPAPEFLARMNLLSGVVGRDRSSGDGGTQLAKSAESSAMGASLNNTITDLVNKRLTGKEKADSANVLNSLSHPRTVSAISVDRRLHEVSQEVMIYFRELTEACVGASENRRHEALDNATLDPGLQPILPHLVTFITEGVRVNVANHNLAILIYLMRLVKALVDNPHISLEPYLHLLVPTVITCVINRQLCAKPITDNHWALRDFAAKQLVTLCNRHNTSTNELYNRVTRELSRALCYWIEGTNASASTSTLTTAASTEQGTANSKRTLLETSLFPKSEADVATKPAQSTNSELKKPTVSSSNSPFSQHARRGPSLGTAVHSMNTLYGILVALSEFGAQCLRILVLPILPTLCDKLSGLVEPPRTTADSGDALLTFTVPNRLSPADQRSFEFLKVMMTNRIAPILADWRVRQNLGTTLEDYQAVYKCMASCLHTPNRNNPSVVPSPSGGGPVTTITMSTPGQSSIHYPNRIISDTQSRSLVTNSSVPVISMVPKLEEPGGRVTVSTSLLSDKTIQLIPATR